MAQGIEIKHEKINGIELAYYTRGQGEPLVLIMGFRGTMAMWDPAFINELAKHFTVILFDNRGAGLSTDSTENQTTIEQMALDTVKLIQALGYQKVHLLGWSMGSMIATQIGIDYPDVLLSLILCSPYPGGSHDVPPKMHAVRTLMSAESSQEEILMQLFPNSKKGRAAAEAYRARVLKGIQAQVVPDDLEVKEQTIERQKEALFKRLNNQKVFEQLAAIKAPTLVAGGMEDDLDSTENVRTVACQIPYAWCAYFSESGHAFASQDYEDFSQLIEIFINSTQKKS